MNQDCHQYSYKARWQVFYPALRGFFGIIPRWWEKQAARPLPKAQTPVIAQARYH